VRQTRDDPDLLLSPRRRRRDWFALEERQRGLLFGRLAIFAAVAIAAVVASAAGRDVDVALAVGSCAGACALHLGLWALQRRWPVRTRLALDLGLVVDVAAVTGVCWASGGAGTPAEWLYVLIVLAATLGYSTRTGVKAAVLVAIAHVGMQLADGAATPLTAANGIRAAELALLLAAATTLETLNERELRLRGDRAAALFEATASLAASPERDDLPELTAAAAERLLPGWRVRVELGPGVEPSPEPRSWREEGLVHLSVPVPSGSEGADPAGRLLATAPAPRWGGRRAIRGQQLVALRTLAASAGGALARAALVRRLAELSALDGLTGVGNRRSFDETIAVEMARARRTGRPLSLVLVDIDRFKRFNDEHGHQAGDEALRAVARALQSAVRAEDRVCRFGGEEFAVLLPATDRDGAREVAERVRAQVARASVPHGPVTVSAGLAETDGTLPVPELIARADARLYEAKRAGRDRVVAGPGPRAERGRAGRA
jgi:diguanylate cyclase (GGDEF)-like protein